MKECLVEYHSSVQLQSVSPTTHSLRPLLPLHPATLLGKTRALIQHSSLTVPDLVGLHRVVTQAAHLQSEGVHGGLSFDDTAGWSRVKAKQSAASKLCQLHPLELQNAHGNCVHASAPPCATHMDQHVAQRLLLQVVRPPLVVQLQRGGVGMWCRACMDCCWLRDTAYTA